ncbi:MAG TPA: hypothetical protein VHV29_02145 [Terriglobales bacterium]|nr:hypothetical protein [Terriglobales bacterium]
MDNPGFHAGLGTRSKAWRVGWAWKAGMQGAKSRLVERKLNPMQAIGEGRKLAQTLAAKLKKDKISSRDLRVIAVFGQRDNFGKLPKQRGLVLFDPEDHGADSHDLEAMRKHLHDIPVGFVVCMIDRENKEFIAHARPLILEDAPLRLLEALVADAANLENWRVS